jgi:hypothetical protein
VFRADADGPAPAVPVAAVERSAFDFGPPDEGRPAAAEGARAQAAVGAASTGLQLVVVLDALHLGLCIFGSLGVLLSGRPVVGLVVVLLFGFLRLVEALFAAVGSICLRRRKLLGLVLAAAILVLVCGAFGLVGVGRGFLTIFRVLAQGAVRDGFVPFLMGQLLLAITVVVEGFAGIKTLMVCNNPRVRESFRRASSV